jgi:hypothetical protein
MVAKSPKVTRYTRVLQRICYLLRRPDCFRPSDRLAGWDSHPLKIADFHGILDSRFVSQSIEFLILAVRSVASRKQPRSPPKDFGRKALGSDSLAEGKFLEPRDYGTSTDSFSSSQAGRSLERLEASGYHQLPSSFIPACNGGRSWVRQRGLFR